MVFLLLNPGKYKGTLYIPLVLRGRSLCGAVLSRFEFGICVYVSILSRDDRSNTRCSAVAAKNLDIQVRSQMANKILPMSETL